MNYKKTLEKLQEMLLDDTYEDIDERLTPYYSCKELIAMILIAIL